MKRSLKTFSIIALTAIASYAQSFNVDIGSITPGAAGGGTPAPVYGAAAGRPGMWNYITGITTGPFALVDLENHATGVTCTRDDGIGGLYGFNSSQTTGYFQSLMDDAHSIGATGASHYYTISGLATGVYTVYSYAWAPQSPTYLTSVTVTGSTTTAPQTVGGALPANNTFALGVTHAIHVVTIIQGQDLVITATAAANYGFLNGFQIIDGYGLSLAQAVTSGSLVIANSFGTAGHAYVNLFTTYAGAFPYGTLLGLDMTVNDAINQIVQGPPFFGTLNANGAASYTVTGIIPSGLTLYCVSVEVDPALTTIYNITQPFSYTTL